MRHTKQFALCASLLLCTYSYAMDKKTTPAPTYTPPSTTTAQHQEHKPICLEAGPFFNVEFLYWQGKVDNLEYAEKDKFQSLGNPMHAKSSLKDLNFEWNPGAKVTLGYGCPTDNWDISLVWTYMHSEAHSSVHTDDPTLLTENLRPTWTPFLLGSIADRASAHWQMNYNILDLELGKSYMMGRAVCVRPHAALRGAWIYQHYNPKYHAGFQYLNVATLTTLFKNTSLKADNDFAAIGMAMGADTEWFLSPHWSFLAKISASLDYGRFRVHQTANGGFLNISGSTVFINNETAKLKDDFWRLRSSLETELGIQWQTSFHNERYLAAFYATYDFVYWPHQNQMINGITVRDTAALSATQTNFNTNIIDLREEGDMQLQGFKVGMRLNF